MAHPLRRAMTWAVIALAFGAAMVWAIGPRPDLAERVSDARFLLEQGAALATGVAAAIAALALTIPGAPMLLRLLPVIPAAVWVGTLSLGCLRDWAQMGAAGVRITPDPACFVYIALIGSLPALVLLMMLRRGVPLAPRWTTLLAGLAAAGIGNFALRFFHTQDAALMVLVWQVGSVAVLALLAGLAGRILLPWRARPV
ncbi:DUF1109 family protein [Rhodobacteraceae bacterium 2376]|uniref:DUF1109 family protein n=2 Tax=Rhabdonatronobacter sediminivivens TaxID=2743469 RepID=A0A7Z0KW44_9RHOB|nr:DUF1109 family protein [Rhabdonatronobacter sediminivivens]